MTRALARIVMGAGLAVMIAAVLYVPLYANSPWTLGDVFVGGSGKFEVYSNLGAIQDSNLPAGNTGDTGGCGFDASLNAYLVNTTQGKIFSRRLTQAGNGSHPILQEITTAANPQSIAFAPNGDLFVGHLNGLIQRYSKNSSGNFVPLESYQAMADTSNSFGIDIAADGTIFYDSGGRNIRRVTFDGSAFINDTLFKQLPVNSEARALRVLPPTTGGGNAAITAAVLVADKLKVKLVDASGAVIGEYDAGSGQGEQNDWFALALDPRDVDEGGADLSFWAGDKTSGQLWKFNVQSALGQNQPAAPQSGPFQTAGVGTLRGACVNGEPTSGQYTVVLNFFNGETTKTATFAPTFAPGPTSEHRFTVKLQNAASCVGTGPCLSATVNAREAISNGVCTSGLATDTSDVDCGFKTYFSSSEPAQPVGAPYVHGRSVYYHVKSWRDGSGASVAKPFVFVTISSEGTKLADIASALAAFPCPFPSSPTGTTPRAIRGFRDPSGTPEDQFQFDLTEIVFIDEWGAGFGGFGNRFMVAGRCATGSSQYANPADGRTFKAGSAIPIELNLTHGDGSPITDANTAPHSIAVTIGTNGTVLFQLNTPGSSPFFWNQIQPGTYKSSLQTGANNGLPASQNPYNFCVSDAIDQTSTSAGDQPLYNQRCFSFVLK